VKGRDSVVLTEWSPRTVVLKEADVRGLSALPRGVVSLRPQGHGRWTVRFENHCGVVRLPTKDLIVRPKIDATDVLVYMLRYAFDLLDLYPGSTRLSDQEQLPHELIVAAFLQETEGLVRRGLTPGYEEHEDDDLRAVRGRIDPVRQVRRNYARAHRLACRFDEFTLNTPENRLLITALMVVHRTPYLSDSTRRRIRRLLSAFEGAETCSHNEALAHRFVYHRHTRRYREAHELGRSILRNDRPGFAPGRIAGASFLIDMNELWERFVAAWLVDYFRSTEGVSVRPQVRIQYSRPTRAGPVPYGRVDVLVRSAGASVPLDTKYKDPAVRAVRSDDVSQVVTYAVVLGAPTTGLLYPAVDPGLTGATYLIHNTSIQVHAVHIRVGSGVENLMADLSCLAHAVEEWLLAASS
jgi:5-methylcytosine-specific restriction enzyme subunit McrC